ncbi:hypothetical protein R6Q57_001754 [Mikania cordata]
MSSISTSLWTTCGCSSLRGRSHVIGAIDSCGRRRAIDYDLLAEFGQQERMTTIIGEDTPWSRLFEMTYAPQYRLISVKFLSTFRYMPQAPDFQPQPGHPQQAEISFRLCGFPYHLSLAEFGSVLGLYTKDETQMPIYTTAIHTADDAVVSAWWPRIGDEPFVPSARVTHIRDSLIRYLYRCIASSVTGRGMSQEWCTSQDFFLYCLLSGRPCNLARCLSEYFSTYYHRQERGLIYGGSAYSAAAAPAHTAAGADAAAAARAQSVARSYQRAADAKSGSVGGFDLVAGACRA